MLSDDELLDFDHEDLVLDSSDDSYPGRRLLAEHGDLFRSHLLIARWIDGWAQRICEPSMMKPAEVYVLVNTLLELVAYLRLGKFLPGEPFYDEEARRQPEDWIRPAPPL